MALNKYRLSFLIEQRREKYDCLEQLPIRGVSRDGFISPKQDGADLSIYNVFYKNDFVFNPARMELNSIALNTDLDKGICSSLYEIFYIKRTDLIIPAYLNMIIKRDEFARKCWFNAIGSARNYFRISDLGEFEIELPEISIQKKYVDIYNALVFNQKAYERGLEDLKIVCDSYIEQIKKTVEPTILGPYIKRCEDKNIGNKCKNVKGVSTTKEFRNPTSKVNKNELSNYKIVKPGQISFVQTTHNEKVFCNALNDTNSDIVVTSVNEVLECDYNHLLPEYLCMNFNRSEFDRYARYHSWGSARETFTWDDLIKVKLAIPPIKEQRAIVNIYKAYKIRKSINERLKKQIANICPILIKGSIEEAKGA